MRYLFPLFLLVLIGCNTSSDEIGFEVDGEPLEKLSDYHFFTGELKDLQPNERVLPYELNSSLFTDYAHKARFVWMPEGKAANYTTEGTVDFPLGAVLIKNFYYPDDERDESKGRKIMETRLLVHRTKGWEALPYVWNEEQTDASLKVVGDMQEMSFIHKTAGKKEFTYVVPNKNQCKGCHVENKVLKPIGPKVKNLNRDFEYVDGRKNQLKKWAEVGYLANYDPEANHPKVAQWDHPESGSLHERAMAYLDINCAHCHNPKGPANTTGLHLTAEIPLSPEMGIWKTPVATGKGSGGRAYSIVPGHPEQSILSYRLESTDPGAMMPELGRSLVHEEGVALIKEWIENMEAVNPSDL